MLPARQEKKTEMVAAKVTETTMRRLKMISELEAVTVSRIIQTSIDDFLDKYKELDNRRASEG